MDTGDEQMDKLMPEVLAAVDRYDQRVNREGKPPHPRLPENPTQSGSGVALGLVAMLGVVVLVVLGGAG